MLKNKKIIFEERYRTKIKWTPYKACAYAEGFCEGENATEDEVHDAWQYIVDEDLCSSLQGWYGRNANDLIEGGLIKPR